MYNSREIGELRADVAVNCRTLIERAAARAAGAGGADRARRGIPALPRLDGLAARTATVPTFHAKGVGLAFDICKNVKGHEYDDPGFLPRWEGSARRWASPGAATGGAFPTGPIFNGTGAENTSSMVRAGAVSAADAAL